MSDNKYSSLDSEEPLYTGRHKESFEIEVTDVGARAYLGSNKFKIAMAVAAIITLILIGVIIIFLTMNKGNPEFNLPSQWDANVTFPNPLNESIAMSGHFYWDQTHQRIRFNTTLELQNESSSFIFIAEKNDLYFIISSPMGCIYNMTTEPKNPFFNMSWTYDMNITIYADTCNWFSSRDNNEDIYPSLCVKKSVLYYGRFMNATSNTPIVDFQFTDFASQSSPGSLFQVPSDCQPMQQTKVKPESGRKRRSTLEDLGTKKENIPKYYQYAKMAF